jgi:hypothetical protein
MPTFIPNDIIAISSDGIDYCCYNIKCSPLLGLAGLVPCETRVWRMTQSRTRLYMP